MIYRLRRIREALRGGPKCRVARCPYRQAPTLSRWCRVHTVAILAGGPLDKDGAYARELGPRRWLLLAEVNVERERQHVAVLDGILAQTDEQRVYSRIHWDEFAPTDLRPPLAARVDELLALEDVAA